MFYRLDVYEKGSEHSWKDPNLSCGCLLKGQRCGRWVGRVLAIWWHRWWWFWKEGTCNRICGSVGHGVERAFAYYGFPPGHGYVISFESTYSWKCVYQKATLYPLLFLSWHTQGLSFRSSQGCVYTEISQNSKKAGGPEARRAEPQHALLVTLKNEEEN